MKGGIFIKTLPVWASNYLRVLGLSQKEPTYDYLVQLCQAHLSTLPFENISKMLYYRDQAKNNFIIPSIETFVEHADTYSFGGTCYTLNSHFQHLLDYLGFSCYLVMLGNEHMGIVVQLDCEKVYVDCGAAAPIFKPVRFESNHQNVSEFADDRVHILPVNPQLSSYKYVRYTQGKQSGRDWDFKADQKQTIQDFQDVIQAANKPGTTFMKILRCQLWQTDKGRSVSLINNQFSIRHSDGRVEKHTLQTTSEIEAVLEKEFLLPKLPVRKAIDVLEELNIHIFSGEKSR
ncbi:arylamine N-acetyltransferase [Bacillus horti]|uniref:Arylamine N-acetyltransferase n=1 Tax=Caldalkalibacillus horti TaxID=77523 RepID=A0ABT9W3Y0_9BACI|nr:arylamine N-acetyltransferase [Bacillus horti]MDQ0167937.1 arylamine N-acetyltransferase [Bacillus horti]